MAAADAPAAFSVDFVGDVVCPWCFLGWMRLKAALAQRSDLAFEVAWRPFQLQFDIPDEGLPYAVFMEDRFPDRARRREMDERLTGLGADEGVEFHLEAIARRPNTNAAHRVIRWCGARGGEMAETIMRAYFSEGRDIGDPALLAELAPAHGLDAETVRRRLASGEDRETVDEACRMAARAGIQGVPFTIMDNRVALSGAETPDRILLAIDKALEPGGPAA